MLGPFLVAPLELVQAALSLLHLLWLSIFTSFRRQVATFEEGEMNGKKRIKECY